MNRLRRFHETVPHGQTSCRVAYATSAGALFKSLPDVEWAEDTECNAGDAILMTERRLQPWTPEDNERLRKLAAEGRTSVTIAERLKRSPNSVRNRAAKLNIVLVKAKLK